MLLDIVRDFVSLSAGGGVRGEALERAKTLMAELRRYGFSTPEISVLSGGVWSDSAVRVYTMGWRGDSDSMAVKRLEKDSLMGLLRTFALSNRRVEDMEWITQLDVSAKSKGSSVEEVAELDGHLEPLGLHRGEVGKLVGVSRELRDMNLTPAAVQVWIGWDKQLEEEGFTKSVRKLLLDMCRNYGGINNVLMAVSNYLDFFVIDQEKIKAKEEFDKIVANRTHAQEEYNKFKEEIASLNLCLFHGWTLVSILFAPKVLRLADTPEKQKMLTDHLNQLSWVESGEGKATGLVKKKKAIVFESLSQVVFVWELIVYSREQKFFDYHETINFLNRWKENFPGHTIGETADSLLEGPEVPDEYRKFADWLHLQEDLAKQMVGPQVPT